MSEPVTMYTTQWCAFCRRLKSQLARDGIEVAEVQHPARRRGGQLRDKCERKTCHRSAPDFSDRDGVYQPVGGPGQREAARARRELMSGKHDQANADARVRAGESGVPGRDIPPTGRPGVAQTITPLATTVRARIARVRRVRADGVSRAGAGDGLSMTHRRGAGEPPGGDRHLSPVTDGPTVPMDAVARRTPTGWRVGDEEVPDLTSAMVLADLLAAELSAEEQADLDAAAAAAPPAPPREAAARNTGQLGGVSTPRPPADRTGPPGPAQLAPPCVARPRTLGAPGGRDAVRPGRRRQLREAEQLKETVAQLERALTVRVRVEQAIGVLAEKPGTGPGRCSSGPGPPPGLADRRSGRRPARCYRQRDQPAAAPAGGTGQAADAVPAFPGAQPRRRRGLSGPEPGTGLEAAQPHLPASVTPSTDIPQDVLPVALACGPAVTHII